VTAGNVAACKLSDNVNIAYNADGKDDEREEELAEPPPWGACCD